MALYGVGYGDLLAKQAVRRRGDLLHREVGNRLIPTGDNTVNGDTLIAIARGHANRRWAKIPVAIGQQQHRLEVALLPEHRAKRSAQVGANLLRLAKRVSRGHARRRAERPGQYLGAGLEWCPVGALVLRVDPGGPGDDVIRADDIARLHAARGVVEDDDLRRVGPLDETDILRLQQCERQHRHRHESINLEQGDFAATAVALPVAPAKPGSQRQYTDPG